MSRSIKHRRLLQGSILLSLLLHLGQLHFLQRQALWFSPSKQTTNPKRSSIEKGSHRDILKEAFDSAIVQTAPPHPTYPLGMPSSEASLTMLPLSKGILHSSISAYHFPNTPFPLDLKNLEMTTPPLFSTSLSDSLPKHEMESLQLSQNTESITPKLITPSFQLEDVLERPTLHLEPQALPKESHPLSELPKKRGRLTEKEYPLRSKIPSLQELNTSPLSQSFDTELVYQQMEENSYLFALTLIPKTEVELKPLRQKYLFLIDRSNSIQKERLNATKNAISKAIKDLNENDCFNIIVFDQKIDKLSHDPLVASPEALSKAEKFLDKIELGSFFSHTNLSTPLYLTLPAESDNDEVESVILFTDGEHLPQELIFDWTRANQNKTSLYVLAMNEDAHLPTLKTMAHLNRGKLLLSPTHRGLKRKLLKLMKMLHCPIAKNLNFEAIAKIPHVKIELLPQKNQSSPLFFSEPFVILGKTNSLEDFVLFIQGKVNGKWLHIKKNIAFSDGKKALPTLKSEWAQQRALSLFYDYLHQFNPEYLVEADQLLKTYNLPEFFQ